MARVKSLLRRSQHEVKNNEPDQIEVGSLIIKKIPMKSKRSTVRRSH